MDENSNNKGRTGRKIYRWLSYLVALMFILLGLGILGKILLPEPFLTQGSQRLLLGGVILVYGIARITALYLKGKRERNRIEL